MAGAFSTRFSPGNTLTGQDATKTTITKEFVFASDTYPAGGFSVKVSDYLSSVIDAKVRFVPLASVCTSDIVARYKGKSADESHIFLGFYRAGSGGSELATGTALTDGTSFIAEVLGARL